MEFEDVPQDCIANIISFTTPRDTCAMSLVSSTFRSTAQSNIIWDKFLPSDYPTIIPTSSCFPSKKDIYLYLSQNPILIDNGLKSFVLEKMYGKKCYMLSARSLFIVWGDTPKYWRWISLPDSRFREVAKLVGVCWLEIKGTIKTCMLSPKTLYGAYLVFKLSDDGSYGFDYQPVEASIGIVGESNTQRRSVYLDAPKPTMSHIRIVPRRTGHFTLPRVEAQPSSPAPSSPHTLSPSSISSVSSLSSPSPPFVDTNRVGVEYPKERKDGWLEVELGDFFNKGGEENKLEMGVYEVQSGNWKSGIILQGIEIRPKLNLMKE